MSGIAAATLLQRSWAAGLLRRSDTGTAAALLALTGCAWLAQAGSVSAADLAHSHPSFHPVADLAQGVRSSAPVRRQAYSIRQLFVSFS